MSQGTKLYCAWFCPFAQRAWIGLIHKGVDFEYVETDPYDKTPEFLALNPRGLVPVILNNGKTVYDSYICLEYLDDAWPLQDKQLFPQDAHEKAYVRIWCDHINRKIVPPFYGLLMSQDKAGQEKAKTDFVKNLRSLMEAMGNESSFFIGKQLGVADIMLFPYTYRIYLLEHYRNFELPKDGSFKRLFDWMEVVHSHPSIQPTLPDKDKLLAKYLRYADDTAETEVATATRTGTALP